METFRLITSIVLIILGAINIIYSIFNRTFNGTTLNNLYNLILGGILLFMSFQLA